MSNKDKTVKADKATAQRLVPKLRFPKFQDAGAWEEKRLFQVCEVNPSVEKLPKSFVYIDLESVVAGVLLQKKIIQLEGAPSRAQRHLKNGDVIFQMVRPYQKNNYFFQPEDNLEYVASTGYAQLRAHQSNMYLFQYLHNERFVGRVLAKCTGSNYPAINSSSLSEITLEIPDSKEQKKIADCLSSIDELITAQAQKLDTLKAHKKGLMQQLFPAEGETVPKLRFPEFRNAGEWEEKKLERLSLKISDGIHATPLYDDNGEYYFINGNNLIGGGIEVDKNTKKVSEEEYQKHKRDLNHNTILLSINGTIGNISVCNNEKVVLGKSACYININNKLSNKYFIMNFLKTTKIHDYFFTELTGSTIKNLSLKTVKNTKINLPPNIEEQQKIADCLSSIDNLITAQAQKLDTLKTHKKGLMQQLFPSANEVTG